MFVPTDAGMIPVRNIIHFQTMATGTQVTYWDGSGHAITGADPTAWDNALADIPVQMTPAASGTFALEPLGELGAQGVNMTAVLAWSVSADGFVYPVCHDGINSGKPAEFQHAILHPDGRVEDPEPRLFWRL